MRLQWVQWTAFAGVIFVFFTHSAFADQNAANYNIPADVLDSGGADVSKSNSYTLSDSIGESVIGYGSTDNYVLNSGYRQPSAADFLSISCSSVANIGSVVGTGGPKTGSGTCVIYSDAYSGYYLGWSVLTGSGGTNTGSLINEYNDTIASFTPSVMDVPDTWAVPAADAEWGARLRSDSTDASAEWGVDGVSEKWLNISTTNRTIVTRSSATPLEGSVEVLQFRAEVGASSAKTTGVYQTAVTFTAVSY